MGEGRGGARSRGLHCTRLHGGDVAARPVMPPSSSSSPLSYISNTHTKFIAVTDEAGAKDEAINRVGGGGQNRGSSCHGGSS